MINLAAFKLESCYNISMNHLIDYFVPEHYNLFLNLDKQGRRFGGTVTINGKTTGDEIRLHVRSLKIKAIRLDGKPTNNYHTAEHDELVIVGHASEIRVDFSGVINETDMHGLYLGKYKIGNEQQELLATQFESHYARELFPCVDEPAAKATFTLKVQTTEETVLSNMPGRHIKNAWEFETTPRMSTYLLAICAGSFQKVTGHTKRGVEVSVYATHAQDKSSLEHALEVATRCIDFYEDYFGVEYPLTKSDHVALPDFSAGAMENWGLITYRETALLASPADSQDTHEYVATVIAHELAHQWFGDLVTMQWWNDLWLNESFASMMEHYTIDKLYPEYRIWDDYETSYVPLALKRDALQNVQAVRQDVNDPAEIDSLFDSAIVYGKGERLLKMLMEFIGEDKFRNGLTSYFKDMAYHNATADDLWQHLSDTSEQDIKQLMSNWLTRPGYPVVTVSHVEGTEYRLTQQRYLTSGKSDDTTVWSIPLFSNASDFPALLNTTELVAQHDISDTPLQLNLDDNAHFITKYDDKLWQDLMHSYNKQNTVNQVKLLREALMLNESGNSQLSQVVTIIKQCQNIHSSAIWTMVSSALGRLGLLVEPNSVVYKQLKQFVGRLVQPQWQTLSVADKSTLSIDEQKLWPIILSRSIYGEIPEAKQYALDIYHKHQSDVAEIASNIRACVLSTAVRYDDAFRELFKLYQSNQNANLRTNLAAALTSCRKEDKIQQLLECLTDTNVIKPQDTIFFVSWLLSNVYARKTTWRWLRDHWSWIRRIFGGDMTYDDFVRATGSSLRTPEELAEHREFFTPLLSEPAITRTIKLAENEIENRIKWITANQGSLSVLIQENN